MEGGSRLAANGSNGTISAPAASRASSVSRIGEGERGAGRDGHPDRRSGRRQRHRPGGPGRRRAGQGDDGVEVEVGPDHGGESLERTADLVGLLGHRDQAQVAVPPPKCVVAGQRAEDGDPERHEGLAQHGRVGRASRPG